MSNEPRGLLAWLATLEPLAALAINVTDDDLLPLDEPESLEPDAPASGRRSEPS